MRIIILLGLCLALTAPAAAQTNCRTFGNMTHCNGPNGETSDSQTNGNQTRTMQNGPNGQQRITTCRTYGTQTICN
jgi:hypothetical protein